MNSEGFNLDQFMEEKQEVVLPPEKQEEVDTLITEFQGLPDNTSSFPRIKEIIERLNWLYEPPEPKLSEESRAIFNEYIDYMKELSERTTSSNEDDAFHLSYKINEDSRSIPLEEIPALIESLKYNPEAWSPMVGIIITRFLNKIIKADSKVALNFTVLGFRIDHLGRDLPCGEVILIGEMGDQIGREMKGGNLKVIGSSGNRLGRKMEGGNIEIEGNAGNFAGEKMKGGDIKIIGNSGSHAGDNMEGGQVEIMRNSEIRTGFFMKGGKIIVHGDSGLNTAEHAGTDAEIHINGEIESLGENKAKIFHKGVLIE